MAAERISVAPYRPTHLVGSPAPNNQQPSEELNQDLGSVQTYIRKSVTDPLAFSKLRTIKFNNFNFVFRGIPKNKIDNQRYTFFSFLPIILFDQFKYFFNMFFLVICIS